MRFFSRFNIARVTGITLALMSIVHCWAQDMTSDRKPNAQTSRSTSGVPSQNNPGNSWALKVAPSNPDRSYEERGADSYARNFNEQRSKERNQSADPDALRAEQAEARRAKRDNDDAQRDPTKIN